MKYKYILPLIFCLGLLPSTKAQNIQLDSLEPFIEKLMKDFEVTGLSLGIVKNDSILYAKGFGTRKI
ncbi:MAG: hypothetical protein AAFP96_08950, partial [Bacteroidota bacterium]